MRRRRDTCRIRGCAEPLRLFDGGQLTGLCPSCRRAGRLGGAVVFLGMVAWKAVTWWLGV